MLGNKEANPSLHFMPHSLGPSSPGCVSSYKRKRDGGAGTLERSVPGTEMDSGNEKAIAQHISVQKCAPCTYNKYACSTVLQRLKKPAKSWNFEHTPTCNKHLIRVWHNFGSLKSKWESHYGLDQPPIQKSPLCPFSESEANPPRHESTTDYSNMIDCPSN